MFVTCECPGVDVSGLSVRALTNAIEHILTPIMANITHGAPFYASPMIHIVGFHQPGKRDTHSHIHFVVNQRLNKHMSNIDVFDAFKRHFRDPVLKSAWSIDGL